MEPKEPRQYIARNMESGGWSQRFTVLGGPLSAPQQMGWHITNERGFTVAVSCDSTFAQRINDMEALLDVLRRRNALYLLKRIADEGYTSFTDEERELMERMLVDGK